MIAIPVVFFVISAYHYVVNVIVLQQLQINLMSELGEEDRVKTQKTSKSEHQQNNTSEKV